jgi:hypothetical protein
MCAPVRTGLLSVDVYMLLLAETKLINSADQRAISGSHTGRCRSRSRYWQLAAAERKEIAL